ncbi:hypothetical protein GLOIN_2v1868709 [Rhizophagus clarus]|nr:hypothetical protein GLOIN_2v1868709 [Rhizophagus clarus]
MPTVYSSIINLPPELFIEICSLLPPIDLFTLSQVCRKFYGYLRAPNSLITQQIWKESRLKFMPKEDMPPPEGMSEEKYAELLMTERGCQICKRTIKCKIYWEFAIRCCEECHSNKTIRRSLLIGNINCPEEFVDIMPYTHMSDFIVCRRYYWIEQIDFAYSQYYSLSKKKKKIWLDDKKIVLDSIMNYASQRELREYEERKNSWDYYPFYLLLPPPSPYSSHKCFEFPIRLRSPVSSRSSRPPLPPLFRVFENAPLSMSQILHYHIQRLENESHQTSFNVRTKLNSLNNFLGNRNEQERDNFMKTKKKKGKGELKNKFHNNKLNKSNMKMKGKNFKNKFAYKYG